MKEKKKVIVYITKKDKLLVFKHAHFPEAGIQVPAGAIEPGEELAQAAIREAKEETGLNELKLVENLGYRQVKMEIDAEETVFHQHYFHLICLEETSETWIHLEKDPSEITPETALEMEKYGGIVFEFYWVPINAAKEKINKFYTLLLDRLIEKKTEPAIEGE
jgi:8-oxo-dGTP pyrophosphatase MutT (NUDIX family)